MRLSSTENTIINAMARAFFVAAFAAQQEERAAAGKKHKMARGGEDWMEVAPKTPRYAREFALMFAGKFPSLLVCLNDAAWADVIHTQEQMGGPLPQPFYRHQHPALEEQVEALKESGRYTEDFGHYLAMQGMGTGVSWFDDHARFDIDIPHVECNLD